MPSHAHPLEVCWLIAAFCCFCLSMRSFLRHMRDRQNIRRKADRQIASYVANVNIRHDVEQLIIETAMIIGAAAFTVSAPPPPDPIPAQTFIGLVMLFFMALVMGVSSILSTRDRERLEVIYEEQQQRAKVNIPSNRSTDGNPPKETSR